MLQRKITSLMELSLWNLTVCFSFLQVAKVRFGKLGHAAFMFAALVANFVISSEILVGGSGVITGLTNINMYAAIWLLPFVIVLYVLTGGLRATFAWVLSNVTVWTRYLISTHQGWLFPLCYPLRCVDRPRSVYLREHLIWPPINNWRNSSWICS